MQLGQKYAAAVVDAADVVVVVVSGIDLTDKEGGNRIGSADGSSHSVTEL